MFRKLLATTAISLALAGPAPAGPEDKVSKIEVSIDLSAVTNAEAAKRFATIADDLQSAIGAVLVDRILPEGEEGIRLTVDINEVELSNSYSEMAGLADTRLDASVNVADSTDNSNAKGFRLIVSVDQALPLLPPGTDVTVLPASSDEFYNAMVEAFAQRVVEEMDK